VTGLHYDRQGRPITFEQWARTLEHDRRVAFDALPGCEISTVWLGIDHNFGKGPPLIFETMIFGGPDDLDRSQWRYATEEEARAGHVRAVELARLALTRAAQGIEPALPPKRRREIDLE
jgi:hypothetical protein